MSTVLMYTSPARGHLYPMMDVALALREAGHRVVMQTLADEADRVVAEGLDHRPIAPAIEALAMSDYQGGNPLAAIKAGVGTWLARAPHEVADLEVASGDLEPDLLLVDVNSWGAAAYAEAQHRPWAMFLPYCLPVPSPDTPAFGPGLPPPHHALDRLRDKVIWAGQTLAVRKIISRLNELRVQVGAAPLRTLSDLYLRADVLLYRTAEPFEYPRAEWPQNVHAIGPGLWAPPGETPDWLDALPHPRVLVSVSTEFQDDGAIISTALQALAEEPGSIVVTTASVDPEQFRLPHDRAVITRTLPHAAVIPEMDVVVTHGGMGTTQRALAAGVPVCVVPWGRDQSESARRAQESGAGVMVPRSQLTADRLRAAVREAYARTPGAGRVSRGFRHAGGAAQAVTLLEGLLERTAATASP